jgi:hypothetical protein
MSIKKNLIALTIAYAGMVSAHDEVRGAIGTVVVGGSVAAIATVGETIYKCFADNIPDMMRESNLKLYESEMLDAYHDKKISEYSFDTHKTLTNNVRKYDLWQRRSHSFLGSLPIFSRDVFCRNVALLFGGKYIYDVYKSTKKEKYS